MIGYMMRARLLRDTASKDVLVEPGQPAFVEIEAIKRTEVLDGPGARVTGTVFVNGRPDGGVDGHRPRQAALRRDDERSRSVRSRHGPRR